VKTPRGDEAATVQEAGAVGRDDAVELARGATLGRYVVLDRVGAGGMGVVYSAYDPELDRKIAVKLLKPRPGRPGATAQQRVRLVREAQAMARLQHPNVITVLDVGTLDERVFVAMEFVDGRTLTEWLDQSTHTWREIVEVFALAGRGLGAAHDAGIVHRDFKPDNVLIGADGHVYVTDFGLARAVDDAQDADDDEARSELQSGSGDALSTPVTRTGVVLGTPAYMAPEQHLAQPTDARSDQFSFCIALYEGLFGERPFAGDDAAAVAANILAGKLRPEPKDRSVPGAVRRVLLRGLHSDRDQRYDSMGALLADLTVDHGPRRRRLILGAAVATAATAAVFAIFESRDEERLCTGGDDALAQVWSDASRGGGRDAFIASDAPGAPQAWQESQRIVDAYGVRWTSMYREACTATHERGVQSQELLDLRMQCLRRRLGEVEALANVFQGADGAVVANAVNAAAALTSLDGCANAAALQERVPPPEDKATGGRVEELREGLAAVKALVDAAKFPEARTRLDPLVQAAMQIDYAPIRAEARYQQGLYEMAVEDDAAAAVSLEEAVFYGEQARDDELVARACSELVYSVGYKLTKLDRALEWDRCAEAKILRLGGSDELEGRRLQRLGIVIQEKGDYDRALDIYQRALALREKVSGIDSAAYSVALSSVAGIEHEKANYAEAVTLYERALAIKEKIYGPDHIENLPVMNNLATSYNQLGRDDEALALYERGKAGYARFRGPESEGVALALSNIGNIRMQRGRFEDARDALTEAIRIYEQERGPNHPDVAGAVSTLAISYATQGKLAEAEPHFKRVVDIRTAIYGEDHAETAYAINNYGTLLADQKKYDEALPILERALQLKQEHLGAEHPGVSTTLDVLAKIKYERGDFATGIAYFERSIAIREKAFGADSERVSEPLLELGALYLAQHKPARAVEPLERALKLREAAKRTPAWKLAEARFALAKALWDNRADRKRARQLAQAALSGFEDGERDSAEDLAEVKAWLAKR